MMSASEIWNTGVSLAVAMGHFTNPATLKKYNDQTKALQNSKIFNASPAQKPGPLPSPGAQSSLSSQAEYIGAVLMHFAAGKQDLQLEVTGKLKSRQLVAAGYFSPRQPGDQPRVIPFDVWEGNIDWKASTVTGNGMTFFSVRVAPPTQSAPKTIEHESPPLPVTQNSLHRSPGRPGVEEFISSAYEALKKEGAVDHSKPRTASYPLIRAWLARTHPADAERYRSLSDKTLARHTKPLFERDKKSGTKL